MGHATFHAWYIMLFMALTDSRALGKYPEERYVGCYGTDYMVYKPSGYIPSKVCYDKCEKKGIRKLLVVGGRWCYSGKMMGPIERGIDSLHCDFIPMPWCRCYEGDPYKANGPSVELALEYSESLPNMWYYLKGFDCHQQSEEKYVDVVPMKTEVQAKACRDFWPTHKYNYTGYLTTHRCGCKSNNDPADETLLPVDRGCAERMICIELPLSSCMLGEGEIDPTFYGPGRVGPLYSIYMYKCLRKDVTREPGYSVRKPLRYRSPSSSPKSPEGCILQCRQQNKKFADVAKGGYCSCGDTPGEHRFTDSDCQQSCINYGAVGSCGGPFTASVYATDDETAKAMRGNSKTVKVSEELAGESDDEDEGLVLVESEDDFIIEDEDDGFQIDLGNKAFLIYGGVGGGIILITIILICCLCRDPDYKKRMKAAKLKAEKQKRKEEKRKTKGDGKKEKKNKKGKKDKKDRKEKKYKKDDKTEAKKTKGQSSSPKGKKV